MVKVGYRGKVISDAGAYYAPYVPIQFVSWQEYLRKLEQKFNSWITTKFANRLEGIEDATELMKQHYPGNYTLTEKYDPARGVFALTVVFENPKEEMLWKIKWTQ